MSGRVRRRGYSTRFMRDMRVDLVRQSGGRFRYRPTSNALQWLDVLENPDW